ncbi:MAG: alginate export family protein, partial [Candidatus Omnitrophota bacterium]
AWALQAMADYTFADVKFTPAVGASYTYLSGDKKSDDNTNRNWDSMYYDQVLNNITYSILPFSNMQVINLRGSMKPTEDTTVLLNYGYYRRNKGASGPMNSTQVDGNGTAYSYTMTGNDDLGSALDLTGTYDYTEDVQFGLTFGYFNPGKAFAENNRRDATQVVGSMKVTF